MPDIQTIAGKWRLVSAAHASLPTSHYMEVVFSVEDERVRGEIVGRDADGRPPVGVVLEGARLGLEVVLDGFRLRLRIIPPVPVPEDTPEAWLVLTTVDDAFEGYWELASGKRLEPAIALRLVRVA